MGVTKLKVQSMQSRQDKKTAAMVPIQSKKSGGIQKKTKQRKQKQLTRKIVMRGAVKGKVKGQTPSDDEEEFSELDDDKKMTKPKSHTVNHSDGDSSNDSDEDDVSDNGDMELDSDDVSDTDADDDIPSKKPKISKQTRPVATPTKKTKSPKPEDGKKAAKNGATKSSTDVSDEDVSNTLYVSRLTKGTTEDDLYKFVTSRGFAVTGCRKVVEASFGFVQFPGESELQRALEGLAAVKFGETPVFVARAKPKGTKIAEAAAKKVAKASTKKAVKEKKNMDKVTMFVKPIGPKVGKDALRMLFPGATKLIVPRKGTGETKGFALLRYETEDQMKAAMAQHQGVKLDGRELILDVAGNKSLVTALAANKDKSVTSTQKKKKVAKESMENSAVNAKKAAMDSKEMMKKKKRQSSRSPGESLKKKKVQQVSGANGTPKLKQKQQPALHKKKRKHIADNSNGDDD